MQQVGGSQCVGGDVVRNLIHGLANANCRGQMVDHVYATNGLTQAFAVTNISVDELNFLDEVVRIARRMHLLRKIVENSYFVAAKHQRFRRVRSNESCSTCNKNGFFCHRPI